MSSMSRHLHHTFLARFMSSSTSSKLPLLWKPDIDSATSISTLQLLSWGRGSSGQLGGGIEEIRLYPTPVASFNLPSNYRVSPTTGLLLEPSTDSSPFEKLSLSEIGISCGFFHSSLLINGNLWMWGKGDGGRLGFGHENPAFSPTLNPNLDCVRSTALGGLHSVALTTLGDVYTWGYGGFGALGHSIYTRELLPRMVNKAWSGKICQIAASGAHTAAVSESGDIYTWGRDEGDGRLGLGPSRGPNEGGGLSIPSKVKGLSVPMAAVSCGGFFTAALTKEGQLWNWGANSNYELGRGNKVGGWKPQVVSSLQDVRIIQIACGGYHSLALTDKGKVLSWGHGGHGQLGHSSIENQKVPLLIEALAEENVVYVTCEGSTSAAFTDKGKLYMWGNSRDCQLGVPGLPEVQHLPVEVKFPLEHDGLGTHRVLSVAVGASHAMCLVLRSPSQTIEEK